MGDDVKVVSFGPWWTDGLHEVRRIIGKGPGGWFYAIDICYRGGDLAPPGWIGWNGPFPSRELAESAAERAETKRIAEIFGE